MHRFCLDNQDGIYKTILQEVEVKFTKTVIVVLAFLFFFVVDSISALEQ